jgi:hypothetical protein
MEVEQMMALLLAKMKADWEEMLAEMTADWEKRKVDMKAIQEKMDAHQTRAETNQ